MMKYTQVVNVVLIMGNLRTTALYVRYSGHNPSLSRGLRLQPSHLPLPAREVTVRALSVWPRSGASRTPAGGGPGPLGCRPAFWVGVPDTWWWIPCNCSCVRRTWRIVSATPRPLRQLTCCTRDGSACSVGQSMTPAWDR